MKRHFAAILLIAALASCNNKDRVAITGTFAGGREGMVYLEQSDVDRNTVIDSAAIKRGRFSFRAEITGPEFYQVGVGNNDFISLLAMPGEKISLSFGKSPLISSYTVAGSPGSGQMQELDKKLFKTRGMLDSLRSIYNNLSEADLALQGTALEKEFVDVVNAQRKYNIGFILKNITSMASVKALYQRIDENTYVLYQPRDLQYLKIVSDSLSVKYPASRHVRALTENVTSELNQMYINRLATIAAKTPADKIDPDLLNTEGQRVKLSSLRGKYVLLTFWSTTSEACMDELAALKSIYKLYNKNGLEIYQVSLDPDENRWKNVIKFEDIPWISVREDDPANPRFAIALNITELPSNLLYDREGNIINTNLYGRNLQIKMDQIFNK